MSDRWTRGGEVDRRSAGGGICERQVAPSLALARPRVQTGGRHQRRVVGARRTHDRRARGWCQGAVGRAHEPGLLTRLRRSRALLALGPVVARTRREAARRPRQGPPGKTRRESVSMVDSHRNAGRAAAKYGNGGNTERSFGPQEGGRSRRPPTSRFPFRPGAETAPTHSAGRRAGGSAIVVSGRGTRLAAEAGRPPAERRVPVKPAPSSSSPSSQTCNARPGNEVWHNGRPRRPRRSDEGGAPPDPRPPNPSERRDRAGRGRLGWGDDGLASRFGGRGGVTPRHPRGPYFRNRQRTRQAGAPHRLPASLRFPRARGE
jgi:hypothetical protein